MIDYVKSGTITLSTAATFAEAATIAGPRARGGFQSTLFPSTAASSLQIFFESMSFEEYPVSSPCRRATEDSFLKPGRRATQRGKTGSTDAAPGAAALPRVYLGHGPQALDSLGAGRWNGSMEVTLLDYWS
jgi:hypothetical protein